MKKAEDVIGGFQNAPAQGHVPSGLLPICSFCRKIRDDKGFWNPMNLQIQRHPGAKFSHTICPECVKKHYPDYDHDGK